MIFAEHLAEKAAILTSTGSADSIAPAIQRLLELTVLREPLNAHDERVLESMILQFATLRLLIDKYTVENAAWTNAPVLRPVFIVGLPRTGSTLLHNLLARCSDKRAPLNWESHHLVPSTAFESPEADPRCKSLKRLQQLEIKYRPESARVHWEYADEPTECLHFMSLDLCAGIFGPLFPYPGYAQSALKVSALASYQYHRRALQLIQGERSEAWILKMPAHSLYIPDLLKIYPDARFIFLHRDPLVAVASTCSMFAGVARRMFGGYTTTCIKALVHDILPALSEHALRPIQLESRSSNKAIFHASYSRLMSEPLEEVRRIHAWLGDPLGSQGEARIASFLQRRPPNRFGAHEYNLNDFGISRTNVLNIFQPYLCWLKARTEKNNDCEI